MSAAGSPLETDKSNDAKQLLVAAVAAFCTYFCMYAFRKPFTAGTFEGSEIFGLGLKSVLVISQLAGYVLSKFIGIKVISEMPAKNRAAAIVGLILIAEAALVGFAICPLPLAVVMLFLNGLPLGMVFGLVLAYLEGRKNTEALSAALCASFIIASGVVKSVGRWLVQDVGLTEFQMPMVTGLIFLVPLLVSVWMLDKTPPPDGVDRRLRTERGTMNRGQRLRFLAAYRPGLILMVTVFVALTIVRTIRDDFGVEIWRDMGVDRTPSVFAASETLVAIVVTFVNGLAVYFVHNMTAIRATIAFMCLGFVLVIASVVMQSSNIISPFAFMVMCGVGLYVPYVAFHTTLFERLIAVSRHPGNLGFLMYVADSIGYLGYAAVLALRATLESSGVVLPFFRWSSIVVAAVSIVCLLTGLRYFRKVLGSEDHPLPACEAASTNVAEEFHDRR